jgi:hypothetical protein
MADFQSAFDANTKSINTVASTQISSAQKWANIPGSLVKTSPSAAGYLWGYNANKSVYVCQNPCNGSWSTVDLSHLSTAGTQGVAAVAPVPTGPPTYLRVAGWNGVQDTNHISFGIGENNGKYSVMICLGKHAISQTFSGIPEIDAAIKGFKDKSNQITLRDLNSGATMPVIYASVTSDVYVFSVEADQATYNFYKTSVLPAKPETITINVDIAITPMSKGSAEVAATPAQPISSILDITTDDTNVYLLYTAGSTTNLATKTANNQTDWSLLPVGSPNFLPVSVFSTHTYLWLQSATNQKVKIPKPVTMTNSMPVADTSVKITSASSTALYGVDASGKAMKTDETLQTGWSPVTGLTGIPITSLVGNIDQTALYGVGQNSQISRCQGDCTVRQEVTPLDTGGYMPLNLTADPNTKQLWMTSSTSGTVGNIFNRIETPDYSSILNVITPADQNRDKIVQDISKDYKRQTDVMAVNKQLGFFETTFKKLFGTPAANIEQTDSQIKSTQDEVTISKSKLDGITAMQPILVKFVLTLIVASFVYLVFSFIGWFVHVFVLVVLGVGIYLSLNNDVAVPGLWA